MNKKILITGTNGLLGQKIVYDLLDHITPKKLGFKKNSISVIATAKGENRLLRKTGYLYETMDITDQQRVKDVFILHQPDVVINTAAMTNVDLCEFEKEKCRSINTDAVKNMVAALSVLKSGNYDPLFIHISTDFVFDGQKGFYSEDDKPCPLSVYAWSKYFSEEAVKQADIRWAILRTIIIYGVVDNRNRSNIVLWAKDKLGKGEKLNVVNDQFRSPTLAEDLAQGCIRAALKEATGIYHVCGKDYMSILELVYKVAEHFNLNTANINVVSTDSLNQPAKRPPKTGFNIDKAISDLAYEPHSFAEGLAIVGKQLNGLHL